MGEKLTGPNYVLLNALTFYRIYLSFADSSIYQIIKTTYPDGKLEWCYHSFRG